MTEYLIILLTAALVNQVCLAKGRGVRPLPENLKASVTLGGGVIFVLTASAAVCGLLDALPAWNALSNLRLVLYLLVIGGFVWLNQWTVKNFFPEQYADLEAYLPLLGGNCAALGVLCYTASAGQNYRDSLFTAFGTGVLLTVLMAVLDAMDSRIVEEDLPEAVRGAPILALCAALLSLALMGLTGLSF